MEKKTKDQIAKEIIEHGKKYGFITEKKKPKTNDKK